METTNKQGRSFVFTSESVSEGHPDKVCDAISDAVLDAALAQDPHSRVACEALVKYRTVVLAGELTSRAVLDLDAIVREAVRSVGYNDTTEPFCAETLRLLFLITAQAAEINEAVSGRENLGAGDQGMMFGYATDETPELMPLPILLAHCLARGIARDRREGVVPWLRPDAKTQVSVAYEDNRPVSVQQVLVSTQHLAGIPLAQIEAYVKDVLSPRELGDWSHSAIRFQVNPSGSFVEGGPAADCGLTGRKIIVDSYGGFARHGGGAFSGKDPSKVDRSGAYFCRYVARQIVLCGLARRAEVQVAYAIGQAQPVSVMVDTFGTGSARGAEEFASRFDFRPAAIIERLGLLRPLYRQTTNYGHFGKPELPWETSDLAEEAGGGAQQPAALSDLASAYCATVYSVETGEGVLHLRIGYANRLLDCLLTERQAQTWAYVTAHNPGSRLLSARENSQIHERLLRCVEKEGLAFLPGQGSGEKEDWPAENSLLLLNVSEKQAVAIGTKFGQNAIVFGRKGGVPELKWCHLPDADHPDQYLAE